MESRYSVEDIANYFLSKGEKFGKRSITPLKIQKLVYYAQGFYLALFNKPLFNERIEAWQHGPVCRILYNKYKKYSYHIISEPIDCNSKMKIEKDYNLCKLLDAIWHDFGIFNGNELEEMTHRDIPWIEAIQQGRNTVISTDSMKKYFYNFLKSDN